MLRLPWPSLSGTGLKAEFTSIDVKKSGMTVFNWFDASRPSHIRNAVNEAYRAALRPMPPVSAAPDAECLVELGPGGAGRVVLAEAADNPAGQYGVMADGKGTGVAHPAPSRPLPPQRGRNNPGRRYPGARRLRRRPGFDPDHENRLEEPPMKSIPPLFAFLLFTLPLFAADPAGQVEENRRIEQEIRNLEARWTEQANANKQRERENRNLERVIAQQQAVIAEIGAQPKGAAAPAVPRSGANTRPYRLPPCRPHRPTNGKRFTGRSSTTRSG